jgi:hypothetical protein
LITVQEKPPGVDVTT